MWQTDRQTDITKMTHFRRREKIHSKKRFLHFYSGDL